MLSFQVVNNSKEELVLLKPNNTFDSRIDFFSNTMECEDIPLWESNAEFRHVEVSSDDYLTVGAKSTADLVMNGRNYSWLACNSDSVVLKIMYEPFTAVVAQEEYAAEKRRILKEVSAVKIYSREEKVALRPKG